MHPNDYSRRAFLRGSAVAMFGAGMAPLWLAKAASAKEGGRKKILVAIFQRGAADGLNVVVPHGEKRYYELRPGIAIQRPGSGEHAAIDLDGFFGLNPNLAELKPLWDAKQIAIVHAAGSPDPTRSHFDAQDYMESGTPGLKATRDGWLNRALGPGAKDSSPIRAVALTNNLPRTLRGRNPGVAMSSLADFRVRDAKLAEGFQQAYMDTKDRQLEATGKETFEAMRMMKAIQDSPYMPANSAKYPGGRLGQSLQQIARLIKANAGLEVAFTDIGGWDHHVNEIGVNPSQGPLANLLGDFGKALAAFHADLGDRMEDVIVVTMSEFGRTAKENGNRGTDHGHANMMFVMGGNVRGGKVHGDWPGLGLDQLYEQRDLAVTTDFRAVLGEAVTRHLGVADLKTVFPNFEAGSKAFRGLLA